MTVKWPDPKRDLMETPAHRVDPIAPNESKACRLSKTEVLRNDLFGDIGKTGRDDSFRNVTEHPCSDSQFLLNGCGNVTLRNPEATEVYGQIHNRQPTFCFYHRQLAVTVKRKQCRPDYKNNGYIVAENNRTHPGGGEVAVCERIGKPSFDSKIRNIDNIEDYK